MPSDNGKVLLADVAERAGVSIATASLALRGAARVAEATRARVSNAAKDVGYRRHPAMASGLMSQPRVQRIGVVGAVPFEDLLTDPFQVTVITGLVEELQRAGALPVFLPPADGSRNIALLSRVALDAVVLVHSPDACGVAWQIITRRALPTVCLEPPPDNSIVGVRWRDFHAIEELARRVVQWGHRDAVVVTLPFGGLQHRRGFVPTPDPARIASQAVRERLEALSAGGLGVARVYESERSSFAEGQRAGAAIASLAELPTVVVCQSDVLAAGVILGLEEAGLRVPHDVSVTGFDGVDLPLIAPHMLTTVMQDGREKGHRAATALLQLLAGVEVQPNDMTYLLRMGNTLDAVRPTVRASGGGAA